MTSIVKWTGIALAVLFGLTLAAGLALYPVGMEQLTRTYPDIPDDALDIPGDSEAVARGRHVATIWACAMCHGADLSGTMLTDDPFQGTVPAANLTAGKGGIGGSYADADWIRAIRHGVKPDRHVEVWMNDYSSLSDQDLGALIAYLKQLPPVDSARPALRAGPLLALATLAGLLTPAADRIDHRAPRPADPVPGATKEYGRYLSAICAACHGPFVARKLDNWKHDDFMRAFRTGMSPNGKRLGPTMSSKTFSELSDTELMALWLYLKGAPSEASHK